MNFDNSKLACNLQYVDSLSFKTESQFFKNSFIIRKENTKEINVHWVSLYLIKTRLNFTSNFFE